MADPIQTLAHVKEGLAQLLTQFQGQPNLTAILSAYLVQIQEIEDMFFGLLIGRRLNDAVGAQLDGLGRIVDLLRAGATDDDYRVALRGQIAILRLNSRIEDIIFVFGLLLPGFTFEVTEIAPAHVVVRVVEPLTPSDPSPALLAAQLRKTKGGGVGSELHWIEDPDTDVFKTADGTVLQADANQGTADPGKTFGGYLSGATG
jgi:hypothetical protein